MANFGDYQIPHFEDDLITINEFLRIVLNTIFFHRWIGETNFEDCDSIIPNITYVKIKNENLQKTIESKISLLEKNIIKTQHAQVILNFYEKKVKKFFLYDELSNNWESWKFLFILKKEQKKSSNNDNENENENDNDIIKTQHAQVILNFYEKKVKKFFLYEELSNIWESWTFLFIIKNEQNDYSDNDNSNKENKIRKYLSFILQKLNDKIDYMPNFSMDIKLPEETFPFEIIINTEMKENDLISIIKDMNIKNALKDDFI